jgi:outer membrane cobalamin receptor
MNLNRIAAAVLACLSPAVHAADPFGHSVNVLGSRTSQMGVAESATSGTLTQRQLELRTTYRPGELLEGMPGLVASQHSGEGKANQFYLRGFNLDHGTDLRTTIDGMPVNQRSHAHGQGWTDMNFIIPELVDRLDYTKGPYSAHTGDFASAGSATITTSRVLPKSLASVALGEGNYRRGLVAGSPELGAGNVLYALEAMHNDGPFTRGDDYNKLNGLLRYSWGTLGNGGNVTAMAYRASWNATDQIPQRAVASGALGRFDAIDLTDGGEARRYSLSGAWRRANAESSSKLTTYMIRNQLDLYSNFTYFMNDPVNGDQFSQPDRRVTTGLDASHTWHSHQGEVGSDIEVGFTLQNDNVFNSLNNTRARKVLSTTRSDHVVESSIGAYAEVATRWNPSFRSVAGARFDAYRFKVDSDRIQNTGKSNAHLASPSLGLIYSGLRATELYFNAGRGFHSNDARGTVTTLDPTSLEGVDPVPGLVRSRGLEFGLRTEIVPKVQATMSLYRLDFDSELVFVGDAGTTEAGPPSRREGVEFSAYYKPLGWLTMDVDLAYARSRARGLPSGEDRIPGAVEGIGQIALTVDKLRPWSGGLRLRYFGPRPLIEDNSRRSRATATVNGRIAYDFGNGLQLDLEVFNLANRRDSAIDYFYESQLKGETAPVADVHFHPIEPRTLRVSLLKRF